MRPWALALAALSLLGCGANHNEEERRAYAEANGYIDIDPATCEPRFPEPPKPHKVDCAAAIEGYEFFPLVSIDSLQAGVYQYGDKTANFGDVDTGYHPPSEVLSRCKGDNNDDNPQYVGHVRGGPFLYYGGGTGISLNTYEVPENDELPLSAEFGRWARDVRQWEGVSFWARRGVQGQSIRVAVGDKYTDDDLAYVDYYDRALDLPEDVDHPRARKPYCRRKLECDCPLGKPCTYFEGTNAGYYCYDPKVDLEPFALKPTDCSKIPPGTQFRKGSQSAARVEHERCGPTQCNHFYPAYENKDEFTPAPDYCPPKTSCEPDRPTDISVGGFDPEFYGRECTSYTLSNGTTSDYCFDPKRDPPPPENDEWCSDIRYAPVNLTTEWQFYTVPFSEMLQYGYAKESFDLDLQSVATVKFTWDRGYIDLWFDDVSLYRRVDR
jgi:hypothetical protein